MEWRPVTERWLAARTAVIAVEHLHCCFCSQGLIQLQPDSGSHSLRPVPTVAELAAVNSEWAAEC